MSDEEVVMEDRFERWLKVSIGMARFEPHLPDIVQNLGQLDASLCSMDARFVSAHEDEQMSFTTITRSSHIRHNPTCGFWGPTRSSALWLSGLRMGRAMILPMSRSGLTPRETASAVCRYHYKGFESPVSH